MNQEQDDDPVIIVDEAGKLGNRRENSHIKFEKIWCDVRKHPRVLPTTQRTQSE